MLNMAALLVLGGRREQALLLLTEVYSHRQCFIEYMQSRLLLLVMVFPSPFRSSTSFSATPWRPYDLSATTYCVPHSHGDHNLSGFPCYSTSTPRCSQWPRKSSTGDGGCWSTKL